MEHAGALKMQDQKMEDLKMEDQIAGVENAGPENAGPPVSSGVQNFGFIVLGLGLGLEGQVR